MKGEIKSDLSILPVTMPLSLLSEAENSLNRSSHLQKEKRKRGNESSETVSKRPRSEGAVGTGQCHISAQAVEESIDLTAERRNKLSRTRRLRQQSESEKLKTSGSLQRGKHAPSFVDDCLTSF